MSKLEWKLQDEYDKCGDSYAKLNVGSNEVGLFYDSEKDAIDLSITVTFTQDDLIDILDGEAAIETKTDVVKLLAHLIDKIELRGTHVKNSNSGNNRNRVQHGLSPS